MNTGEGRDALDAEVSLKDQDEDIVLEEERQSDRQVKADARTGVLIACFYGLTSISITFFNKAVLSVYEFKYSNALTMGQMTFSLGFLVLMKHFGRISYPRFSKETAMTLVPLALFFNGMVVTGLASLRFLNVPMYSALRRFTTVIVILADFLVRGVVPPSSQAIAVCVMVAGAFLAGLTDVTFSLPGYFLVFVNCFVTAYYLVYIKKKTIETELNTWGLMFYNNLLNLPVISVVVLVLEGKGLMTYAYWSSIGFWFCFLMSSTQAFLLNYSIFLCTTRNSALTTSITGQIKNVATTIIGLFIFHDVIFEMWNLFGLFVSTAASMVYTWMKYQEQVVSKLARNQGLPK